MKNFLRTIDAATDEVQFRLAFGGCRFQQGKQIDASAGRTEKMPSGSI